MLISASTEAGRELSFNFLALSGSTTRRIIGCGNAAAIVLMKRQYQVVKEYHIQLINSLIKQRVNTDTITVK